MNGKRRSRKYHWPDTDENDNVEGPEVAAEVAAREILLAPAGVVGADYCKWKFDDYLHGDAQAHRVIRKYFSEPFLKTTWYHWDVNVVKTHDTKTARQLNFILFSLV